MKILDDAGAEIKDWKTILPEDVRGDASLRDIADIGTLGKSYVNAQKLIGADKILKPQANWGDKEWDGFWKNIGRPENPDGYSFKVEPEKLPKEISLDDNRLKEVKAHLHKLGLTDKQASGALQYYLDSLVRQTTDVTSARENAMQQAMTELKTKFGPNYETKVSLAQAVVKKYGSPELQSKIQEIGNDPHFIQLFASIGEAMMEDTARGGGNGLIVTDAASSLSEINQLKGDSEFQKALGDRTHPGHKTAVERWTTLHERAYPSK